MYLFLIGHNLVIYYKNNIHLIKEKRVHMFTASLSLLSRSNVWTSINRYAHSEKMFSIFKSIRLYMKATYSRVIFICRNKYPVSDTLSTWSSVSPGIGDRIGYCRGPGQPPAAAIKHYHHYVDQWKWRIISWDRKVARDKSYW